MGHSSESEPVTFARSNNALPDDSDYTQTCRSCFNANFNVNFKTVFKTIQLCISWWSKETSIFSIYYRPIILPLCCGLQCLKTKTLSYVEQSTGCSQCSKTNIEILIHLPCPYFMSLMDIYFLSPNFDYGCVPILQGVNLSKIKLQKKVNMLK
jgi:hypothetical protein